MHESITHSPVKNEKSLERLKVKCALRITAQTESVVTKIAYCSKKPGVITDSNGCSYYLLYLVFTFHSGSCM